MSTGMTGTSGTSTFKPALWTPGDWNALFGFGTNILVNMLVLTGLLRFVLKMPDSLVFGRILPALGLMMCLSTFYYAWLAYRLAQKTGRSDVCALPSGVSVPHMFIVTFVIMLPITIKTGDPIKGWSAGLVWVFFQSFILMIGGFMAVGSPERVMTSPKNLCFATQSGSIKGSLRWADLSEHWVCDKLTAHAMKTREGRHEVAFIVLS